MKRTGIAALVNDGSFATRGPRGDVVQPDADRRCGLCGGANFAYSNGNEHAANGARGYRCVGCGSIKPERAHG